MKPLLALVAVLLAACSKVVVVVNGRHDDKVLDVNIENEVKERPSDKLKERNEP